MSEREFCENVCSESHSLPGGINEFLSIFSTFTVHFGNIWDKISSHYTVENL
jgi:hypothetical protein